MNWRTPETTAIIGVSVAALALMSAPKLGASTGVAAVHTVDDILSSEACSTVSAAEMSRFAGRLVRETSGFADDEGVTCGYGFGPGGPSVILTRVGRWDEKARAFIPTKVSVPVSQNPIWDPVGHTLVAHSSTHEEVSVGFDPADANLAGGNLERLARAIAKSALSRLP